MEKCSKFKLWVPQKISMRLIRQNCVWDNNPFRKVNTKVLVISSYFILTTNRISAVFRAVYYKAYDQLVGVKTEVDLIVAWFVFLS